LRPRSRITRRRSRPSWLQQTSSETHQWKRPTARACRRPRDSDDPSMRAAYEEPTVLMQCDQPISPAPPTTVHGCTPGPCSTNRKRPSPLESPPPTQPATSPPPRQRESSRGSGPRERGEACRHEGVSGAFQSPPQPSPLPSPAPSANATNRPTLPSGRAADPLVTTRLPARHKDRLAQSPSESQPQVPSPPRHAKHQAQHPSEPRQGAIKPNAIAKRQQSAAPQAVAPRQRSKKARAAPEHQPAARRLPSGNRALYRPAPPGAR